MKKAYFLITLFSFLAVPAAFSAESVRHFSGSGEVTSVDPLYSRITIQHSAIKDFAGDTETEFVVVSADLLKNISKNDLVDFEFTDNKGDVKIEKITRTGQAPPKQEGIPVGKAVQDVLVGTGEVVKGVTQPITPVHDAAGSTLDATTGATGSVLNDANPDVKKKF